MQGFSGGAAAGRTVQVTSWVYGPLVTDLVQQCDSQEDSRMSNSSLHSPRERIGGLSILPLLDGECD